MSCKKTKIISKKNKTIDTALAFSGGIDSTYCLWKYLKENPDKTLLVHHVKMKNYEGRMMHEYAAVRNILNWLLKNNMSNFEYVESGFDYGGIDYLHNDIVATACFTGVILNDPAYKSVKYVIGTANKNEAWSKSLEEVKKEKRRTLRENLVRLIAQRNDIEYVYPIYDKWKSKLIKEMPKELFDLSWYCRTPKNGKPCQECFTCKLVK
jgi:hypothetical protein